MRRLLVLAFVLLLCVPALAAPDAVQDWKKRHRDMDRQEEQYWDGFRTREDAVYASWLEMWRLWRGEPELYKDEQDDLTALRELYGMYVSIQDARIRIDLDLAKTGDAKAAGALLGELLDVIDEIEKSSKEHDEARPVRFTYYYEQRTGVRIHGLAHRVRGLIEALASVKGADAFLAAEGLEKAARSDKKRSLARRAAVLDALGLVGGDVARTALTSALDSPAPGVRIVALEHLVPYGKDVVAILQPRLADVSLAVQRALLEEIAERGADVPAWIPAVMQAYQGGEGLVRARALEALVRLTGAPELGDDRAAWRSWLGQHEVALQDGTWKRPAAAPAAKEDAKEGEKEGAQVEEVPARAAVTPTPATVFYGVGVPSCNVAFLLDGSRDMDLPAELELQTTRSRRLWRAEEPQWRKEHPWHQRLLVDELSKTLGAMDDRARFAVVFLWGTMPAKIPVEGRKKPLKPGSGTTKKILKIVEKSKPQGQLSPEEGLRQVLALPGMDPLDDPKPKEEVLDTVCLLHTGWCGGRWGIPEALVEDFERRNRFVRLQVNTIRITDRKVEAERLMRGLAEVSGGTHHWLTKLP